ncbi:efflux RND transporter periplasmic adaptor subunit [Marinoscillum sp. 108]|uniref:efflux RND transporter periplasmic adaptor subunit n=1 Tax=Marinoscillum sp. 108 TaxID=2653151 RepID=UPI0012F18E64|nr:efflux RND transporter periplasmic adaptor subunit [Marinoscillum sp. 108]VXD12626.1 Efflux RND transporter periplasmic adaptor subunit [Marinoscillum sp. 108]
MRKINQITYIVIISALVYACGGTEAAKDKVTELNELKAQQKELETKISDLEAELIQSGQLEKKEGNKVLITTLKMTPDSFEHWVEVRGTVASRKNVMLSAETMGRIESIKVTEGQKVAKGQLLVQLDADILRNSISEVKTQLELAATIYERQAKLWEQNIGTEVQYLQAKNNKEALESKLKTLNSQLSQSNVVAPFNGIIDNIPVREGEMTSPGMPLVRIVNQNDTYISADVSESFLGKFQVGQQVKVYFPSLDKEVISKIASVGQVIKSENRTFEVEVGLPAVDFPIKPNQVVVLHMIDYKTDKALVVPTKLVQRDSKGSYVYELVDKEGKLVASKVYVKPGVSYNLETEIVEGLSAGQLIAYEGYRELAPGAAVTIKN